MRIFVLKRIALCGLVSYKNYGDQFIAKCVDYIISDIDQNQGGTTQLL